MFRAEENFVCKKKTNKCKRQKKKKETIVVQYYAKDSPRKKTRLARIQHPQIVKQNGLKKKARIEDVKTLISQKY